MSSVVQFRCVGDWLPEAVTCRWVSSSFDPPADVLEHIELAWKEAQNQRGVLLFDGPMCRLESFEADAGRLELVVSRTSYKAFVGTNLRHPEIADKYGAGCLANALGISCALVSADDYLLLGRRNARVAYYPGRIHPFAGAMEPGERLDIFVEARRELSEELRFSAGDIGEMRCMGLVEDKALRQPEIICLVRSKLSRAEIEAKVEAAEHEGVFAVRLGADELRDALQSTPLLTPVGRAAIVLCGRRLFGDGEFDLRLPLGGG